MTQKKVALVTGASAGMGKATAEQLLQDGYIVYGAARRLDKMKDLAAKGIHTLAMDITKPDEVEATVAQIEAENGGVDVLINNAGFGLYGSVEETPIDDARYQFDVNLFGLAQLTQRVLPHMRKNKFGKVVNVSSMGGKIYTPLGAWYHATKHALEGWSDCLRIELAPFGIDVIIVEPGAIASEWGGIMQEGMMKRSGDGPYAPLARGLESASRKSYEKGDASPVTVISDVISAALKARRPKTRYARGKLARPLLFARWLVCDRMFDRILMSQVK